MKRLLTVLFLVVLAFSISSQVLAQGAKDKKDAAPKPDRWEGNVTVKSVAKSSLTVHAVKGGAEKVIVFDAATKWTSQEHGSKKVNTIDVSQVKEGDRVICIGTIGKDGTFHATMISKRLTEGLTTK